MLPGLQRILNPEQIGCYIGDNLATSDVVISEILTNFCPDIRQLRSRRVRCLSHILNLTCQAYAIGKDSEFLKAELTDETLAELQRQLSEYCKNVDRGGHEFVSWVRTLVTAEAREVPGMLQTDRTYGI